eukprot:g275.t1
MKISLKRKRRVDGASNMSSASSHDASARRPFFRTKDSSDDEDDEESSSADEVRSLKEKGTSLAVAGKFQEALKAFNSIHAMGAATAEIHEMRAQILSELEQDFRAVEAAHLATSMRPAWPCGWVTLGRAQLNFGEVSMALQSFEKAMSLSPSNAEVVRKHVDECRKLIAEFRRKGKDLTTTRIPVRREATLPPADEKIK